MASAEPDLSHADAEKWMRELGFVDGGKPDWDRLRKEAEVGTDKATLKMRWNKGEAPKERAKIRAKLVELERKRKEPTETGAKILGLDEWNRIGAILVRSPEVFAKQLAVLKPLAETVELELAAKAKYDEAKQKRDAAFEAAFGSPTANSNRTRR